MCAAVIDSSTKTRVKSALVFGPLVLVVLVLGGPLFTLMMAAAAGIGVSEWGKMVLSQEKPPKHLINLCAVLTALATASIGVLSEPAVSLLFLVVLSFGAFAYNFAQHGPRFFLIFFGIIYIGFSLMIMVWLRDGSSRQGLYHFVTLLFIVWGSDICAYFSGKSIGGPKLAPKISPKKTWAGFIGSSVGAGAIAAGLASTVVTHALGVDTLGGMGALGYFVLGFVLAMFGQAGDLFISMFKRHYGIKDTGNLIPGHGGILDRIDALLLVAYFFGVMATLVG